MTPAAFLVRRHQQGAALVVALVFLIALTLLGLAAMGGNTLQQRMAYSAGETNLAFQGSESALVSGETWLEGQGSQPVPDCVMAIPPALSPVCGNTISIWAAVPPAAALPEVRMANITNSTWWQDQGRPFGWSYVEGTAPAPVLGQEYLVAGQAWAVTNTRYPRYVVEELGEDPEGSVVEGGPKVFTLWYYRVTARGTGAQANPASLVQSVYSKGF